MLSLLGDGVLHNVPIGNNVYRSLDPVGVGGQ